MTEIPEQRTTMASTTCFELKHDAEIAVKRVYLIGNALRPLVAKEHRPTNPIHPPLRLLD